MWSLAAQAVLPLLVASPGMSDPVMAADGHSYERSAIERWLATKSTSPMTGEALVQSFLAPNHTLRRQIREWEEANAC